MSPVSSVQFPVTLTILILISIYDFIEMPTEPEVPTHPGASDFTRPAKTGQKAAKWRVAIVKTEELREERKNA